MDEGHPASTTSGRASIEATPTARERTDNDRAEPGSPNAAAVVRDQAPGTLAERALRESEARYRMLHESLRDAFVQVSMDGAILECNDIYCQMLGYSRDELRALTYQHLTPDQWHPMEERIVREQILARGYSDVYEKEYRRKDGTLIAVELRTILSRDESGRAVAMWALVRDVTARKRDEAALRAANERLAEGDRRKDEFLAILSHELRNPLASIQYALPVLRHEALSSQGERALAVVGRQLDHLKRLVEDLLDVARITTGKITLRTEPVTVAAIVDMAVESATPAIIAGQHVLRTMLPDEPIWVRADAARLAQALSNLLVNSAKYTPSGGTITVGVESTEGEARVRVVDNGVGMAPEAIQALFEMFRQATPHDGAHSGLGIGLAVARRLVELHGGTVEAHSEGVGRGATFVIRVPRGVDRPARPLDAVTPGTPRALRVLIVDDNTDLLEVLGVLVRRMGHEVRQAVDGPTALATTIAFRPDVVLLDLGLPGMSGLDVARELRRRPEAASAGIVALTGRSFPHDRQVTREAGFDRHLAKPADPELLRRVLEEFARRD